MSDTKVTKLDWLLLVTGIVVAGTVWVMSANAQCPTPTAGPGQVYVTADADASAVVIRDATGFTAIVCDASGEVTVASQVPLRGAAVKVCPFCVQQGWFKTQAKCWSIIIGATSE